MLPKKAKHSLTDQEAFSSLKNNLSLIEKERNRHDVLGSFCDRYLAAVFSQEEAKSSSPEAIFDLLAGAVDVRKELHRIERQMDKTHFEELLVGGYFMYGGVDKRTSLPIVWTRSGMPEHMSKHSEMGKWRYKQGTAKALAYIRASLFFYEIAQVQVLSRTDHGACAACYLDESDRRLIDFNPALFKEFQNLMTRMFPAYQSRVVITGAGVFLRSIFKMALAWHPNRMQLENVQLIARDEVYGLVEDARDVPALWRRDGLGRAHSPTDRSNLWCYERCLQDEGKVTTKDVFNPGPWPYPDDQAGGGAGDVASSAAAAADDGTRSRKSISAAEKKKKPVSPATGLHVQLETICESAEEAEW